ncbi:MAG TPA: PLP-dependent aminotransferase family protein [Bryobacteraceae bacterium]|nr:PLP-dependent aminotransferase family protein [Bryobacteraceae bacterium]
MWKPKLKQRKHLAAEILRTLDADIEAGRLAAGEQLPTHRELAEQLRVAPGTVTRAYALAQAQGLVTGTTGRGTFVTSAAAPQDGVIDLSHNLVHRDQRDGVVRRVLGTYGDVNKSLLLLDEEQDPAGVLEHRVTAAAWMRRPGFAPAAEDMVICSGVQHAMHTVLATIAKPGDVVVTEAVTYAGIKAIAALSGLQLRGLPMDSEGMDPQAFEDACRRGAKILYTTPTLHNPTAITMPAKRRKEIARIAEVHGAAILEDDVYGFLSPQGPLPLAAYAPANTYYLLGTSKSIAPGLRVAYATCPRGMQQQVANTVRTTIWETSPLMSALLAKWIEDGTADRTIAFKRAEVASRHELAKRVLIQTTPPPHATPHWWIALPEAWRAEELTEECRKRGVGITPAAAFAVNRDDVPRAVRICLAAVSTQQRLQGGLEIIQELLERGPAMHFTTT